MTLTCRISSRILEIPILYIKPGSPWENAYIESFHDKLRNELLNR